MNKEYTFHYQIKKKKDERKKQHNDEKEKIIFGMCVASSKEEVIEKFEQEGYVVLSLKKENKFFKLEYTLSKKELIVFFSSLSSMDKVGLNILQSLELIKDEIAGSISLRKVCEKIHYSVLNGMPLSEACQNTSRSFTHDYIGLIKIAEKTGKYSSVFDEIVNYIKWNYNTNMQAKKAIRGPIATICFMFGIIILLSTMILPKIIDFITYFNVDTPIYTKMLIYFSTFIKESWIFSLSFILLATIFLKFLTKVNKEIAILYDRAKLHIPLFGSLLLKTDTSRFITFFSIMYNNGAEILDIMKSVSKIVQNKYIGYRIMVMRQEIKDGETIFSAINKEKTFPKMFRKMIAICEATGEISSVLENVRYFYDVETKDTIEKVIGLIKPSTTIIIGVIVAWMGIAMLGPIYANIGNISDLQTTSRNI